MCLILVSKTLDVGLQKLHLIRKEAVRYIARRQGDGRLQRPRPVHALVVPLVPLLQPLRPHNTTLHTSPELCSAHIWRTQDEVGGYVM